MNLFQKLIGALSEIKSQKNADSVEILELSPFDGPVYVIGDVHGCLTAFQQLEALIMKDAHQFQVAPTLILLGDFVDRGPQTAYLIDHLISRQKAGARVVCLMGNHEQMMLQFWAAPKTHMSWLDFGGLETLASYGIDTTDIESMSGRKISQILSANIPLSHISFLKNTMPALKVGRFLLTHAGADHQKNLTAQPVNALLWGDAGQIAPHDLILIHGHFVVDVPIISARCLSIDTGAYLNGRLSCLRLLPRALPAILTLTESDVFEDLIHIDF